MGEVGTRQIHSGKGLVGIHPPLDCSWTWKKICSIKELFKTGCPTPQVWNLQGHSSFKISYGYHWLVGGSKVPWGKIIWARATIPRHAFISWVIVQHRLPTKVRLNKFTPQSDITCILCNNAAEDDNHIFSECSYAKEVWDSITKWWPLPFAPTHSSVEDMTIPLSNHKAPKAHIQITYAIFAAGIYHIWSARNQCLFKNHRIPAKQIVCAIKEKIEHRVLFFNLSLIHISEPTRPY